MSKLTPTQILSIAEELRPNVRHTENEIEALAGQLGVDFPPSFRRLLLQTCCGFAKYETRFLTLGTIADETNAAKDIVRQDFDFALPANVVVFQWSGIDAFAYFSAVGTDDVPVYEFHYASSREPVLLADTVPEGLALCLRQLLEL